MAKKKQNAISTGSIASFDSVKCNYSNDMQIKTWQWLFLLFLVFILCDILRIIDGPNRIMSGREFNSIPLMQSADSYAWLAAAKNLNQFSGKLLPEILRITHAITDIDIGMIGFYLPLILAPLVIVPVFLLAVWWKIPEAAVPAGLMAGASFGFLSRTLTGWLDTDVLSLFFPVSLVVALLVWLERCIQFTEKDRTDRIRWSFCGAFLIGLLFKFYLWFYPNGEVIGLSIICFALLAGLIIIRNDHAVDLLFCIGIMLLAGNGSWAGLGISTIFTCIVLIKPLYLTNRKIRIAGAVLAVSLLLICYSTSNFSTSWLKILRYGKFTPDSGQLKLPSVISTVEEALSTDMQTAIRSLAGNWLLLAAGFAGFVYCVFKRPSTMIFTPLLVLGALCGKFGSRFGMYGGAALGIGLGFGLALVLRSYGAKTSVRWICQAVMACVIFWTSKNLLLTTNLTDWHISKEYVLAFKELKAVSSPDAQLWTWWDWGYAAQYFSERTTYADGGRNSAAYVLPLARVHYTSSPLYAYQLMLFTAEQQKQAGKVLSSKMSVPQYANPFNKLLNKEQDPLKTQDFLDGFGRKLHIPYSNIPEQYLAVTWENMNYIPVTRSFGSWNLVTGESLKGTFAGGGDLKVELRNGLISHKGKKYELTALDMIGLHNRKMEIRHTVWPGRKLEYFALANKIDDSFYPMDESSYNSLMVQMLVAEPEKFEPYFTLVIDRAPHIRIYRLNLNQS
jgi:dolichyl-diphosphooligosaccharide--protein glycosyltransferase